jgi:S1-C subfamily serine protease
VKIYVLSFCIILICASFLYSYNAVVEITNATGEKWSGFIIDKEGYILTKYYPMQEATLSINVIYLDGIPLKATLVDSFSKLHITLLKLTDESLQFMLAQMGSIPCLTLGNSNEISATQPVQAIGYSFGSRAVQIKPALIAGRFIINKNEYIASTCSILPGNGGGPLIANGKVIGINLFNSPSPITYALPINDAINAITLSRLLKTLNKSTKSYFSMLPNEINSKALQFSLFAFFNKQEK